ncbi:MAG: single-stranded DNA-binding protein [Candidatus Sericytochromatia bacterium]|nr:single-stranded DNA-binding protein [Candidatus Tanganyikabacteria bacterium]
MTFVPPAGRASTGLTAESLTHVRDPIRLTRLLDQALCGLDFPEQGSLRKGFDDLTHIYRPQAYASAPLEAWLSRHGQPGMRKALFLGMNPGPWGMGQTGIPFGDPELVRTWMGIDSPVVVPEGMRGDRPVIGLHATRRESSGQNLYGWARGLFPDADAFFRTACVVNFCPLLFFDANGRNVIPTDFRKGVSAAEAMTAWCDAALLGWLRMMAPEWVVGVGLYAAGRLSVACATLRDLEGQAPRLVAIIHPSPQTRGHWGPTGWAPYVTRQMAEAGLIWP